MRRLGKEKRVKGLEPDSDPLVLKRDKDIDDAVAAKASVAVSPPVPADRELRLVIAAWPTLPNPIKAGIIAIVKAAKR